MRKNNLPKQSIWAEHSGCHTLTVFKWLLKWFILLFILLHCNYLYTCRSLPTRLLNHLGGSDLLYLVSPVLTHHKYFSVYWMCEEMDAWIEDVLSWGKEHQWRKFCWPANFQIIWFQHQDLNKSLLFHSSCCGDRKFLKAYFTMLSLWVRMTRGVAFPHHPFCDKHILICYLILSMVPGRWPLFPSVWGLNH